MNVIQFDQHHLTSVFFPSVYFGLFVKNYVDIETQAFTWVLNSVPLINVSVF